MTELDSDRTLVEPCDPMLGALVAGRYQIRDRIAAGGFGAIYRALDLATIEPVAIKILHRQLASLRVLFRRWGGPAGGELPSRLGEAAARLAQRLDSLDLENVGVPALMMISRRAFAV